MTDDGHAGCTWHSQPNDCDDAVYAAMLECWDADPAARPSFEGLKDWLAAFNAPKVGKRGTTEFVPRF